MNITTEKLPKSQMKFCITLPPERFDRCYQFALREASKKVSIEGFRKGRAPEHLVEKSVGKETLLGEASEIAVQQTLPDAIKNEKIDTVGRPEVSVLKSAPGNEFQYEAVISYLPEIELPDYTKISAKLETPTIDEKAVIAQLDELRKRRASFVTVNRAAKMDDMAEVDFEVRMDGVKIEGGESKKHPLILGEAKFIPGFEEHIVGMKAGETKEFTLKFPKDYHSKQYAGKEASFKVTCNLVQQRNMPKLDDAFAKSLGKFSNLEDLKEKMKINMQAEAEQKAKEKYRDVLIKQLIEKVHVELPEVLVHSEIHRMLHDLEHQLSTTGVKLDDYLEKLHKTRDDVEKDMKPGAEKRILSYLVLRAIAAKEHISTTDEQINIEYSKFLAQYPNPDEVKKQIREDEVKQTIREQLVHEQVFQKLEAFASKNTSGSKK